MADFCDAWRSASSHPLFDFKACKCDGVDATGFPASKACGNSAARLVGILAPILIVVVIVCWMRGIKRGLEELALFMAGLFIGVPGLFLIWFYKKFVELLLWGKARGDAVVDTALHKFHKQSGPVVKLKVVCVRQEPVLPGPAILPWPRPCMHGSGSRLHGSTATAQIDLSSQSPRVPTF
ncbi:hypothetical protein BDZ89DRAFT_1136610 [Hymenopellis radicata]|nr:hypothetical protein BDZ89DRAFT_1136610 [Hymenopellis radicata]